MFHARFEGQADVFVMSAAGGSPKRLTMDGTDDVVPTYSHDGRWIYFSSNRSGRFEIWKMPSDGGEATQISFGGGALPVESPDRKTLFYWHINAEKGLWKVPVDGGHAVQVTGPMSDRQSPSFVVGDKGIWYARPARKVRTGT